jgi:hypothetical protein
MPEKTDTLLETLYAKTEEGKAFIPDACRRNMQKELKSHNFLNFNPTQFNIYYMAGIFAIISIAGFSYLGQTEADKTEPQAAAQKNESPAKPDAEKPQKPAELEAEISASAEVVDAPDDVIEAPAEDRLLTANEKNEDEAKPVFHEEPAPADSASVMFAGVPHVKGIPGFIKINIIAEWAPRPLLPLLPMELPVIKPRPERRIAPVSAQVAVDTVGGDAPKKEPAADTAANTELKNATPEMKEPVDAEQPKPDTGTKLEDHSAENTVIENDAQIQADNEDEGKKPKRRER